MPTRFIVPAVLASVVVAAIFTNLTATASIDPHQTTIVQKSDRQVSQVPYQQELQRVQSVQVAPTTVTPTSVPGTTVQTTGPVQSDTTISVGTLAGQALQAILGLFAIPIGGFLSMILFRVFKGIGVNVSTAQEAMLQDTVNRAVVMFGNAAPKMLDGKINISTKNEVVKQAVAYAQAHRADTLKALGVEPGSAQAVQALTARAEQAIADPAVPSPAVQPAVLQQTSGGAVGGDQLEAAIMRVLEGIHAKARAAAEAAATSVS